MNGLLLSGIVLAIASISVFVTLAIAHGRPSFLWFALGGIAGSIPLIVQGLKRAAAVYERAREERPLRQPAPDPDRANQNLVALGEVTTRIVLNPDKLAASTAEPLPGLGTVYDKIAAGLIRAHLQVIAGPNRGNAIELLHDGNVTIGRGGGNALDLKDPGVSVDQCRFAVVGDGVVVHDIGSRNGTFVNGDKVEKRKLANCDIVAFGSTRILVTLDAGSGEITE